MTPINAHNTSEDDKTEGLGFFTGTKKRLATTVGASAVALALVLGACSSDDPSSDSSSEATETAEGSEGSSGEGSGGSGGGEAGESHGGNEGGGLGEAAESGGAATVLNIGETFDEIRSGARLVLSFDANTNAFVGSVENTTNGPLTRARVEVHLDNGTELGPTTPVDLAPGEVLPLNLPSTQTPFQTWTAHPEVGSGEGGSEAGSEGTSEGGSEGGSASAPATYLTTTGTSRGVFSGPELQADDYYADELNDLEFALAYDRVSGSFLGRVKNEANDGLCDARIKVIFDGNQANSQSLVIPSLEVSERATFTLTADTDSFTTWTAETETFTCNNAPIHGGGGEGGGEGAGGEGGNEGGGEGAGHESGGSEGSGEGGTEGGGENEGPALPIDQGTVDNINGLDLNIGYDQATKAFTGVLTNNTSQQICDSRLEIHVNRGSSTIELGPTVDAKWAPGQTRNVVLGFDAMPNDTYSLHPEVTPCP